VDSIRVHTLRLHGPLPPLPMAPQPWVEDALRCARVPSRWHNRWVLVRRMRLRLGARADACALSKAVTAQWQLLAAGAQPGERASEKAHAVWFADEPAARLALLSRVLQGQPTEAWFWQQVMPGLRTRDDLVQALLCREWRQPVGAARAEAFSAQAGRLLRLAQAGESEVKAAGTPASPDNLVQWPHDAMRARSDAAAALAPRSPPGQASRTSGQRASVEGHSTGSAGSWSGAAALAPDVRPNETGGDAGAAPPTSGPAPPLAHACDAAVGVAALHQCPRSSPTVAPMQFLLDPGAATAWGGFLFALNLWRQQVPDDATTAVAWLRALATWLRVAPDDGLVALLQGLDAGGRGTQPLPLRHLREQALRLTRLPLRRLLAGPGLIRASATHIDIHLPLRSTRLPVRRTGLDLDPGWQPLLQRVVAFHYESCSLTFG
jgi:hypothetical protein